ncbi:hypothetical protein PT974_04681 [Cladobotryum mycophilum]|uniref:N-acetyltransferase domain-containing protein n=1 Tax=Cladobotryum mycophilum TaxID=491253 RepID=A0ABR0SVW1_9HYPO
MPTNYHATILSKDSTSIQEYLPMYKEYRLEGLKRHPDAFATCYRCESMRTRHQLESMLSHPSVQVVLCTPKPADSLNRAWTAEWAAMMQLHGPSFANSPEGAVEDALDMSWCISGGYIRPNHRGSACILRGLEHTMRRVVQQLTEEYLRQSQVRKIDVARARLQLWVVADSGSLLSHYEMMGFTPVQDIKGEDLVEEYASRFPTMRQLCCHNYIGREVVLMEMVMEFDEQQLLSLD